MPRCLLCGIEQEELLCSRCKADCDLEDLCQEIGEYKPGSGENSLWDEMSQTLEDPYDFRDVVYVLADELPSPRKEWQCCIRLAKGTRALTKASSPWLYEIYEQIKDKPGLGTQESCRIKGLVLMAYMMDHDYENAELVANELCKHFQDEKLLPRWCYHTLGEYYSNTRRYEMAEDFLKLALQEYYYKKDPQDLLEKNQKRKEGLQAYMPKDEIDKGKYTAFMKKLGFDIQMPSPKKKKIEPIPKDQYPSPVEEREALFDSFVAFDVETTGLSPSTDAIIEIGAVKVVNGNLVDRKEFSFQEFVKPYKKSLSQEVTNLTGIQPEDVKNAREMWEVIPDFLDFAGDHVLVGFNSIEFDSKFLVRAGRYSHRIIENKHFDVMRYAVKHSDDLGISDDCYKGRISLEKLGEKLGVENPQAHRALADAITTARIYLKLRDLVQESGTENVDDLLADLDLW